MAFPCPRNPGADSTLTASSDPTAAIPSSATAREIPYRSPRRNPGPGNTLQQDSCRPDRPDHPQIMLSPRFYPCPLRHHPARASTFPMCRCENWTKGIRRPPGSQLLQQGHDLCPLQLRSGDQLRSRRLARICRAQRFRQHAKHHQPRAQRGDLGNPHLLRSHHQPVQRRLQPHFQPHPVFGDRSCEAAKLGIPGANLDSSCFPGAPPGLSQSTTDCVSCGMTTTSSVVLLGSG